MFRLTNSNLATTLIGLPAMAVAVWFIVAHSNQPAILIASVFFLLVCITDTLYTKIPNVLTLSLLTAGIVFNLSMNGLQGGLASLLGALTGFALFFFPYLLGMGAGDVKALAALGALLGPSGIFEVFLYTALIGGVLAIIYFLLTPANWKTIFAGLVKLRVFLYTKDLEALKPAPQRERQRFPYAAAIALGFFAFTHWGPIVKLLPH